MRSSIAKRCYKFIYWNELAINAIIVIVLVTCRKQFANFYAPEDQELNELLQVIFPLAGITVANMLGAHFGAVFALAIQEKLVPAAVFIQWFLTLPLALTLSYRYELGAKGLFIA